MIKGLSEEYYSALEDAKKLHAGTNKFSGKFLRPHAKHLKSVIDDLGIKSILDYGCGKGLQYEWVMPEDGKTLEEYWGVEVTKYDPAWPPFAEEPTQQHDLVICSHVLGCIPVVDLPTILKRIFALTGKFFYVVEAIGHPKKDWVSSGVECPVGWSTMQWIDVIAPLKPEAIACELVVRYRSPIGTYVGRFLL